MTKRDARLLELARRLYGGDARQRKLLSPDIVWHVPGHNPVSGIYSGYDEYFGTMEARMAPLDRWDFELQRVMVNGEYVVVHFHILGARKGKQIDLHGSHILRFDSKDQIIEGWGFADDQDALDEFFAA